MSSHQWLCSLCTLLLLHITNTFETPTTSIHIKDLKSAPAKLKESPAQATDIKLLLPILKNLNKPTTTEQNPTKLKRKLGGKYDPFFMSVSEPDALKRERHHNHHHKHHNIMMDDPIGAGGFGDEPPSSKGMRSVPAMSNKLRYMRFFVRKDNGKRKEMGKKVTQKFQRWLWNLSRCPVRYRWVDAGENMFPRFIKTGSCSKKKTCSFPSGMKCIISDWKSVEVLLYTCPSTDFNSVTSPCDWRPFKLDILTSCKCGCQK